MPEQNKIDKKKEEVIQSLAESLADMSNEAYRVILEELEKEFKFEDGKFVTGSDFNDRLNRLTNNTISRLQESPKFAGNISKFIKRLPEISDAIGKFQMQYGVKVPEMVGVKKVIVDEIINQMLDNGLNQNFVQPLRDMIYRNATTGLSLSQARKDIEEYIKGGNDKSGKLHSYIEQTAQQSVDMYSGAINKKLMELFDYNAMIVTGTIIDNSAPQCIYAVQDLKGVIKRSDWPSVKDKATKKAEIIPGTTFNNLPIMLLHWGCRHGFYPVII